ILHFQHTAIAETNSPLSATAHCFVWLFIAEPYKAVCLQCKAHTQRESTQLTL
ncbi:unnamed protein product, partial [Staurois parvus]